MVKSQRRSLDQSELTILLESLGDCHIMLILLVLKIKILVPRGAMADLTLYDKGSCSLGKKALI